MGGRGSGKERRGWKGGGADVSDNLRSSSKDSYSISNKVSSFAPNGQPSSLSQLPELLTPRRPHLHIRDTILPVLPPTDHANLALDIPNNASILILVSNLALSETIQLLFTHRIHIHCECETDEEAQQRHKHGNVPAVLVSRETAHGGEESAAGDGGHDEGGAAFGVFAETADAEGEDEGEL